MQLEKLELELKLLQESYQNRINEVLPKDGNLSKIDEVLKKQLLDMNQQLNLLRTQIYHIKYPQGEEVDEEQLIFLKALEEKFKDD